MRVAIVHDYLTQFGGAERVLSRLMKIWPNANVFTLINSGQKWPQKIDQTRIRTSFLQKLPGSRRFHRYFPLLMPLAIEQFDLSEYDVVLSDTHSFAKGVVTGSNTLHVSYCFTPMRYAWDDSHRYVREFAPGAWLDKLAPVGLSYLRVWDYMAAQRVDEYVTLSKFVAGRIDKYYGRESSVITPPVQVNNFKVESQTRTGYLIVSRLVPYKRIDIAIRACAKLGASLSIVGTGPERERLEELAQSTQAKVSFLGQVSDDQLPRLYAKVKALLFPQEEDFGITPLEAAAAGTPTIAFAAGGALETIIDGETGILFEQQASDSLIEAMKRGERVNLNRWRIRQQAEKFDEKVFDKKIKVLIERLWQEFQNRA